MAVMYCLTCGGFGIAWLVDWVLVPFPFLYRFIRVVYGLWLSVFITAVAVLHFKVNLFIASILALYVTNLVGFFTAASIFIVVYNMHSNSTSKDMDPRLFFFATSVVSKRIGDYTIESPLSYIFPSDRFWTLCSTMSALMWGCVLWYVYTEMGYSKLNAIYITAMRLDAKSIIELIQ
jgi:hypothetical protein